jgi:PPK2 family polyphosphate:nucleotide phosphotransferase
MDISKYQIKFRSDVKLSDIKTGSTGKFESKKDAEKLLEENIERMAELQDMLYAQNKYALLVIIQAMDTAGKDGTIKHVMSGLNPQGTQVYSFKQPSQEELDHDYLWRAVKNLPERGRIGIFNRSHYEDVLVVRVHNLQVKSQVPEEFLTEDIWKNRFRQIRDFERHLHENGIVTVKLFLHISKEEQTERLIARIDDKAKNWKFSAGDLEERKYWDDYQHCYEDAINETSTDESPWYVIPADKKWFARLAASEIIIQTLEGMKLAYPKITDQQAADLVEFRRKLENNEV